VIARFPTVDYPIDAVSIRMEPVKAQLVAAHQPDDHTTANAKRKAQSINGRIQLIPGKDARRDSEIVFKHKKLFQLMSAEYLPKGYQNRMFLGISDLSQYAAISRPVLIP